MKTATYNGMWRYGIILLLFIFLSRLVNAQDNYYWVGGSGNWSDYQNHWATSSGGTEFHTSIPSIIDSIYFDQNSFSNSGQIVTFDLEGVQNVPGMDWTGSNEPVFEKSTSDVFVVQGSLIFSEGMQFNLNSATLVLKPRAWDEMVLKTSGVGLENTSIVAVLSSGSLALQDSLSVKDLILRPNTGRSNLYFKTNGHPINIENKLLINENIAIDFDISGSTIYTQSVTIKPTSITGQMINEGSSLRAIYENGITDMSAPVSLFDNYIIETDHRIVISAPTFKKLEIKPGVELKIDDAIDGITFDELVAVGTVDENISIKSDLLNAQAKLINSGEKVEFFRTTLQDIEGTGGAQYYAYGSTDNGNVSGITFTKKDQEIGLAIPELDYDDVGEVIELDQYTSGGVEISYLSDNHTVATIVDGYILSINSIGTAQITASVAGDDVYNEAEETQVIEVSKAPQNISFSDIPDTWIADNSIELDATTTSGLAISYEVTGPGELDGSTLNFTGTGTIEVTAIQSGDDNYLPADDVLKSFEVYKATQAITFSDIADTWVAESSVELDATTTSDLAISYEVTGPGEMDGSILNFTGVGTIEVAAIQVGDDNYLAADEVVKSFEVYKETHAITFSDVADTWVAEGSVELDATTTSGLAISYEVTGPGELDGSTLNFTGTGTIEVTANQSGDDNYLPAEDVVKSFEVYKETQTISFSDVVDTWVAEGSVELDATTTSGLSISYEVTGPGELDGSTLNFTGTGTIEVKAIQSGDDNYLPAEDVLKSFEVYKETQTISFSDVADTWVAEGSVELDATTTSGLAITYEVSGPGELNGSTLNFIGTGTIEVSAIQVGNDNYLAADEVVKSFEVYKETQAITFSDIPDTWVADGSVGLEATTTSGLGVSYEISGPGELDGSILNFTGAGTIEVTASQAGDDNYLVADEVVKSFEVYKETQTITFSDIPDTWMGDGLVDLAATASSGLSITYQVNGPGQLDGTTLILTGVGTIEVIASQDGNVNYLPAGTVVKSFDVFKESQTITFSDISDTWVGEVTINLEASSTVGLPITYQVDGPASVEGDILTLSGEGTISVTAVQEGNDHYETAESVTVSFESFRAEQSITFNAIEDQEIDNISVELSASSSSGLSITYEVSGPATLIENRLEFNGLGTVQVIAKQEGSGLYLPASQVVQSFEIYQILGLENQVEVEVYPNPVQRELHIRADAEVELNLIDQRGILLHSTKGQSAKIDFSSYGRGIYYLKVGFEGETIVKRIVRN